MQSTIDNLLNALRKLRDDKGIKRTDIEDALTLGPGWVEQIETGKTLPTIDVLLSIAAALGAPPSEIFGELNTNSENVSFKRGVYAVENDKGINIHFPYTRYDAVYELHNATLKEFNEVIDVLRRGLANLIKAKNDNGDDGQAFKMDAVANSFMKAVQLWPTANPSDLWWFIVYRAYCDPFNHPAAFARLNFTESWKRTSGWALEKVLVDHYEPLLQTKGIEICIPSSNRKAELLAQLKTSERLESDKVDVCLVGKHNGNDVCFGVVHVKASFAERRTDDVPMSQSLVKAGYVSPLWTMDCKSPPSDRPHNRGELGRAKEASGPDRRSAKRKDIEDDGYFSACFSYNTNTIPTPTAQNTNASVYVCTFSEEDTKFVDFIEASWSKFKNGI